MLNVDVDTPRPDDTTDGSPRTAARRRRGPTILVVLVLVASLVTGGLGLRWRSRYQPLSIQGELVESGDRLMSAIEHPGGGILGGAGVSGLESAGVAGLEILAPDPTVDDDALRAEATYRDGEHVTFGVALRNTGRVGVTITGFDLPSAKQFFLLAVVDVRVGRRLAHGHSSVVHTDPFHPFTLRAGETRDVVIRERMHACESNAPGGSNEFGVLGVRYRVLRLSRHADLAAPVHVVVTAPARAECPRPAP
jgi:hypothetical protein